MLVHLADEDLLHCVSLLVDLILINLEHLQLLFLLLFLLLALVPTPIR